MFFVSKRKVLALALHFHQREHELHTQAERAVEHKVGGGGGALGEPRILRAQSAAWGMAARHLEELVGEG